MTRRLTMTDTKRAEQEVREFVESMPFEQLKEWLANGGYGDEYTILGEKI